MQWADSSIAYYAWYRPSHNRDKFCGVILRVSGRILIDISSCLRKSRSHYLCEYDVDVDESEESLRQIALYRNTTENLTVDYVTCLGDHVTHSFLSCDVQSACWARQSGALNMRDIPSFSWCSAPLTSLPPLFTCSSSVQLVPYTLVCDTRHDCLDLSDEDFCVHMPCSRSRSCSTSAQVKLHLEKRTFCTSVCMYTCV